MKYSPPTWLKCEFAITLVQRRSRLKESCFLICMHITNHLPLVNQLSVVVTYLLENRLSSCWRQPSICQFKLNCYDTFCVRFTWFNWLTTNMKTHIVFYLRFLCPFQILILLTLSPKPISYWGLFVSNILMWLTPWQHTHTPFILFRSWSIDSLYVATPIYQHEHSKVISKLHMGCWWAHFTNHASVRINYMIVEEPFVYFKVMSRT